MDEVALREILQEAGRVTPTVERLAAVDVDVMRDNGLQSRPMMVEEIAAGLVREETHGRCRHGHGYRRAYPSERMPVNRACAGSSIRVGCSDVAGFFDRLDGALP
ncbi:hypothetical protein WPS_33380 [Vulcanimicrobium alpinum]|uniref:Uncharacterized protein n=1 Tax=Vulcanimicrobium alpinum TaxID=3016050 RepID=A0AAN1Y0T1_UNVUL|nr:hypothetical protein WPS_33380 [Vulcanimicrobium alpinum]